MKRKILVVDDDLLLLGSLGLLLSEEGYIVDLIDKSALVRDSIDVFKPDLIIMDILLDDGDGREICDSIKNSNLTTEIPIILLTALSHQKISEFDCQADAIIGKPYNAHILLQTAADLLKQ
ncbi:response regulator [Pedobacter soli]|uniref:Response regulator receiver domain-containing protein n=1 Tax=Pedobacter soli TaxID=390242 RepID=A0A1G6WWC6_9SPHI|nr:response regulator [Pedobacter soli]SDD70099.1 Response regulator receiver domain-containing protein [Pedobacter soli]